MKIDLRNLSHSYDVKVLNDINFNLKGYKSVAIIGISGSGKSTLLRLLSGLETPTKGNVFINDSDVLLSSYKKSIGFIFQNHNLFPHLSLLENITIILEKTRGHKKDDAIQIAKKYLDLLKLSDQYNKSPRNVSGGQAQRASIARALSLNKVFDFY
jgi:ABC-type polar amino acid transport system ATPase subunit